MNRPCLLSVLAVAASTWIAGPALALERHVVATVESIGGFAPYRDTVTLYRELEGNQTVGGSLRIRRVERSGSVLVLTGSIGRDEFETLARQVNLALSSPWWPRQVRAPMLHPDLHSSRVTYAVSRVRQTVRRDPAAKDLDAASSEILQFLRGLNLAVRRVATGPRFTLEVADGRAGTRRTIKVRQDGFVRDVFESLRGAFRPRQTESVLDAGQVASLEALVRAARASHPAIGEPLPAPGGPRVVETGTHVSYGREDARLGGRSTPLTPAERAVFDLVKAAGGRG